MTARTLRLSVLLLASLMLLAAQAGAQNDLAEVQVQMAEARRHFEALAYEQAVPALDRTIAILNTRRTPDSARMLSDALEMRARARFGLGDQNGAREDFVALLRADPGHTLSGQISPRVVAMFEEAQKATITTLRLSVTPATAEIQLDNLPVKLNATLPVLIGDHTLTATQPGYRPGSASFTAIVNTPTEVTLTLARSSAVLTMVTSPPEVDVFIDGVSKGKTVAGPSAGRSAPLVVSDVGAGAHRIEYRRACYVQAEQRVDVAELKDFMLDPVTLTPAMATVAAQAAQPNATVIVDGQDRGPAPQSVELCEGEHTVELRSPLGRYLQRVNARPGQRVEVTGALRPAFALVSASSQGPFNTDLRLAVERALEPVRSILVFAPPADRVDQALKAAQMPADWLSFDVNRRPLGVAGDLNATMRRDLSTRIARAFDAQGIASVTIPSPVNRNRLTVTLLGAGSAEPDVVELSLDRPETIAEAVSLLDRPVAFLRPAIGISTIDVADVAGAIVIAADGPAAAAGVAVGDIITKINDQAVANSAAVSAALAARAAGDTLTLDLTGKGGAVKKAEAKVVMTPRLIGMNDQMLLANRLLADFRTRVAAPANASQESIIRLNMAAALARLQAWSDARTELEKVQLPEGAGVGNGTVQYLLGLCLDSLGNRAEAETAFRAAAASESWMTEDGPPVKELAEAKLAELQRRTR